MLKFIFLFIGLVVGGIAASGVFSWLMYRQQQEHAAEIAVLTNDPLKSNDSRKSHKPGKKYSPDEQKVIDLCLDLVKDFENNRFASIYRMTTASYQNKNERKMFDQTFGLHQLVLQNLESEEDKREYKITKLPGEKGYDFYFTGREKRNLGGNGRLVNITFTMTQDPVEWRIAELEVVTGAQ